ncbi:MAG: Gfo/Idh/MocA family oxidoreductase [Chloroflexota bacterium]|jgi:predicted dehydrogenase|nr:Gfo/Idh/MocA family oxidoreductase [Chloroflexota bacterium]MDP6509494.1 Gfo/Idh/MocA family oxidoreductase [Chloroflexota bacterium]MDP6757228.1 Gfo/Idh/MocA family oxidoreductase [Chloroflexota bacterium]
MAEATGKVNWGVLSTAQIGRILVIPAGQKAANTNFLAIASRDHSRAEEAAEELGIPRAYGSYEELLADDDIQVIYNPLPLSMHAPWTVKAAEAGKHILCEKPIAVDAAEAQTMVDRCRELGVILMEAFQYHFAERNLRARKIVESGRLGTARLVKASFNVMAPRDAANIRNQPALAGGGLADIGSYCVGVARFIYDEEPLRVLASLRNDPEYDVDFTGFILMEFAGGKFAQLDYSKETHGRPILEVLGTEGRMVINDFHLPSLKEAKIRIFDGAGFSQTLFSPFDSYMLEVEAMSDAVLYDVPLKWPPEEAVANIRAMDAIRLSSAEDRWVELSELGG